ncbi:tyrosine-type recombinase/integrase [Nocardioides cavernaquae]|uniref:Site-specific integrase n=1 Tax=Nocardioides cavernaquae TaxID=2321396 RepID=A0A3A5H7B6_9ACTN|nr:tyrosine-type recombinase/integrase [Nocardioides cavernaquae]RJS46553.1 site-specific integrase [Nocardioides cavernaquae]
MASVERLTRKHASGKTEIRYRVRWRDPDGRQKAKTFIRKGDADRFRSTIAADLVRDAYRDPDAGRVLFRTHAAEWLMAQTFTPATRDLIETRLRLHTLPVLGNTQLRDLRPSAIQSWLKGLDHLAVNYRRVLFDHVMTILNAAVDDGLIAKNPCKAPSVRKPALEQRKVVPWPPDQVNALIESIVARHQLVAVLAAGTGLRQGEIFGLSPSDFDLERDVIEVRRQVKLYRGHVRYFDLPKGGKTRTVALPGSVRQAFERHLEQWPTADVTHPWAKPDGDPVTFRLFFATTTGQALKRDVFNEGTWWPALRRIGVLPSRETGCHALRHFYASTLLDAGVSIKVVSEYLGHADPAFTLRTYTHLMPNSDGRVRNAVDAAICVPNVYPDAASTA